MKKKVGVVGIGFIGVAHVEALRRLGDIEVVAICTTTNAKEKSEAMHVPSFYEDYHDMIDNEDLDAIHICTPNNTHFPIAKYAIEHNIDVLLEKPLTLNVEEAKELVSLAKQYKVKNGVNFHNRFYPTSIYMKQAIKDNVLGDITSVHGAYIQDWLLYDTDYSWRLNKDLSGNTRAIADIGSHWLDLMEYVTGLKVTRVMANMKTVYPLRQKPTGHVTAFQTKTNSETIPVSIDTEDLATIQFELSNGAIGTAIFSQVFAGEKNGISLKISGKNHSYSWDLSKHEQIIFGHRDKPNEVIVKDYTQMQEQKEYIAFPSGHTEGFPDTFKQVFDSFYHNKNKWVASFEDGLRQMLLNDCIFESCSTEKWVTIED